MVGVIGRNIPAPASPSLPPPHPIPRKTSFMMTRSYLSLKLTEVWHIPCQKILFCDWYIVLTVQMYSLHFIQLTL